MRAGNHVPLFLSMPTPLTTNRSIEAATECRGGAFSG